MTFSISHFLETAYADGLRDGRDSKQLSIQQKFFELQKAGFKEFELTLNVTNKVFNGRRWVSAYGTSTMKIIINSPPINGTCDITIRSLQPDGSTLWVPAETGKALVDEFKISCRKWVDPDGHTVNKYVFKSNKLINCVWVALGTKYSKVDPLLFQLSRKRRMATKLPCSIQDQRVRPLSCFRLASSIFTQRSMRKLKHTPSLILTSDYPLFCQSKTSTKHWTWTRPSKSLLDWETKLECLKCKTSLSTSVGLSRH